MKIFDIINEEILEHFLNETHKSIQEIKDLASDVIKLIAKNNIPQISKDGSIKYLYGTYLNQVDANKYNDLKDFITNTNIAITINDKWDNSPNASYSMIDDKGKYDPKLEREIDIYVEKLNDLIEEINQKVSQKSGYNENDLYMELFYKLYSYLIHEIQHAYDDYRSDNKSYQTKEFSEYKKKYMHANVENNINQDAEQYMKYLNLPHEVWARFSQAMYNTHFTTLDWENEDIIWLMKPIKEVLKDFKYQYAHFRQINDKMKRKLLNKVVSFWHIEQDKLNEKNK